MAQLFHLPREFLINANVELLANARAYFFETNTANALDTYTTDALNVAHQNPVLADSFGVFPAIYLDPARRYKLTLNTAADALIYTQDPVNDSFTAAQLGSMLYEQTAAEVAAGVTPGSYAYAPGYRARYATLADLIAVSATHPAMISDDETITSAITVPTGAQIYGIGHPLITQSTAGGRIFGGDACARIIIDGVRFKGANSSTTPTDGVGGYPAASCGLVTFTSGSDIRITNCEFDTFYNGLAVLNCDQVRIFNNRVTHWLTYGILASESARFWIDYNDCNICDQAGAANAYGIMATGDNAGGDACETCSISFNHIKQVRSWDGIMSHDCTSISVIGNIIEDVRMGIDIGHFDTANVISDVLIANNIIKLTTTDTYAAAAANHGGIMLIGADSTHRVERATVSGNEIYNFGNISGMTLGGDGAPITIEHVSRFAVTGNSVIGVGNAISAAGVYLVGTIDSGVIVGNTLQGAMGAGGVRCVGVTAGQFTIADNSITQTTSTDPAVQIDGSTITALNRGANATNSSVPFVDGTSTLTFEYKNSGATSVADGGTITHRLRSTPTKARCQTSVTGEFVSVTALGATTITVAIKKHDNSAGTTQTIYWEVEA